MLTTIFTGHTLQLETVQAVGPIKTRQERDTHSVRRTLYIELHIAHTAPIVHDLFAQTLPEHSTNDKLDVAWREADDEFNRLRQLLTAQWEESLASAELLYGAGDVLGLPDPANPEGEGTIRPLNDLPG